MSKVGNAVRYFNRTVRTFLMAAIVGGLGFAGYQGYVAYNGPKRELASKERELQSAIKNYRQSQKLVAEQDADLQALHGQLAARDVRIDDLEEQLDRIETAARLMKLRRRIARLEVLEQPTSDEGQKLSKIRFYEVGDQGQSLSEPAEFTILGDRVYIEYLVVKFDDRYIEQADLERGTAICLFERIFGENQEPGQGFVVDKVGSRPVAYERGSAMSEFEKGIWEDFWTIANDREKASELGIRSSHAQAPSIRVKAGNTYELDLRSTGEFSLQLIEDENE